MKKERFGLVVSIIINIIIAIIKISGGLLFNSYILITNGYYTLCNLTEDILALVGSLFKHRRANRRQPFGFGSTECKIQIGLGILFIGIAIFILLKAFTLNYHQTNPTVIFIILTVFLFQVLNTNYKFQVGKSCRSQMLIESSHSNYFESIILLFTSILIILNIWISFFDFLGCIIMATIIFYKGMKIIYENVIFIKGENANNQRLVNKIKKIIDDYSTITYSETFLININKQYYINIEIGVNDNLSMSELIKIENSIKEKIYLANLNIKTINFNILSNNKGDA